MADGELVAALLVGNDQLNEVKLKNHLGADFFDVASEEEVANVVQAGFGSLGPVGLPENVKIIADRKVQDVRNAVVGANEDGYHLTGVNPGRDFTAEYVDIVKFVREKFLQTDKVSLTLRVVSKLGTSLNSVLATQQAWEQMSWMKMAVLYQLSWVHMVSVSAVSFQQ